MGWDGKERAGRVSVRTLVLVEHPLTAPCLRVRLLLLLGRKEGQLLLKLYHPLPERHARADNVRLCGRGRESEAGRVVTGKERRRGLGKERAIVALERQ